MKPARDLLQPLFNPEQFTSRDENGKITWATPSVSLYTINKYGQAVNSDFLTRESAVSDGIPLDQDGAVDDNRLWASLGGISAHSGGNLTAISPFKEVRYVDAERWHRSAERTMPVGLYSTREFKVEASRGSVHYHPLFSEEARLQGYERMYDEVGYRNYGAVAVVCDGEPVAVTVADTPARAVSAALKDLRELFDGHTMLSEIFETERGRLRVMIAEVPGAQMPRRISAQVTEDGEVLLGNPDFPGNSPDVVIVFEPANYRDDLRSARAARTAMRP